jgi:hypothetical protein
MSSLRVTYLWAAEPVCGGVRTGARGTKKYAMERGCVGADVVTFSFQDRPFYEKLCYEVFDVLEGIAPGNSYFYHIQRPCCSAVAMSGLGQ